MTTIDRGNEPLMQACSSNLPAVGHCTLESYEEGRAPLCYYHRKSTPVPRRVELA
jgi:hypothetical protein